MFYIRYRYSGSDPVGSGTSACIRILTKRRSRIRIRNKLFRFHTQICYHAPGYLYFFFPKAMQRRLRYNTVVASAKCQVPSHVPVFCAGAAATAPGHPDQDRLEQDRLLLHRQGAEEPVVDQLHACALSF